MLDRRGMVTLLYGSTLVERNRNVKLINGRAAASVCHLLGGSWGRGTGQRQYSVPPHGHMRHQRQSCNAEHDSRHTTHTSDTHLQPAGEQLELLAPIEPSCDRGSALTKELDVAGHEVLVAVQVQHRCIRSDDLVQPRPRRHGAACFNAVSARVRPLLLLLLGWRCRCVLTALQLLQRQRCQRLPSHLLMMLVTFV